MDNRPLTRITKSSAKSPAELLGYLQLLSRDAADGNTDKVLDAVVRLPAECLGVPKAILLHACPDGGPCLPIASHNVSWGLPADCHSPQGCIVRQAILTQTPQFADHLCDPLSACADIVGQSGDEFLACIPVVTNADSQTALICTRHQNAPLRIWEIEFLNVLANHAASALNHRVADDQSIGVSIQSLERLHDAVYSGYQLQELLDALLPEMLELLGADTGSVMLCEDDRHRVVTHVGLPVGVEHEHHSHKSCAVSARVLAGRRPVLLHGPLDTDDYPGATPRHDIGSAIVAPLMSKRKPIGLLSVNRAHRGLPFSQNEVTLVRMASQFLALAVDNTRLYDMVRSQTRHFGNLYQVAKSITANLQLESLVKVITKRLRSLVQCDACAVFLRNNRVDRLDMVGDCLVPGDETEYAQLADALCKAIPSSKRVLTVADLTDHRDPDAVEIADRLGLRSAVLATFTTKRKHSGAIGVFSGRAGAFDRQDASLILGLTELAGIAIENAWLYEQQAIMANISEKELRPRTPAAIRGFQVGSKYAPAFRVGGDYFDLIRIDDRRYGLAIIDVAGKDIAASVHVAMCKYALRALGPCITSPAQFMSEMNRFICEHLEQDKFVSMMYAVIDTTTGEITYSFAGHEPALLYKSAESQVVHLRTSGILLGVKNDATFAEGQSSIDAGDVLFLYTDGVLEALAPDSLDASENLDALIAEMGAKHPQEIADNVYTTVTRSKSGHPPDDIAIVAIKRTSEAADNVRQ